MGRIRIGKDMVQFSCKLEVNPDLWGTRAGRMNGKSAHARMVNSEIDKINVSVNSKYLEIISGKGEATANDVKNSFQGIALSQETLLKVFRGHNEIFKKKIGVTRTKSTFWNYKSGFAHLKNFVNNKYHVSDVSFKQLDYSFIENYAYYLRIDCRMMPNSVLNTIKSLRTIIKIAIRRGIISHNPFAGYISERPKPIQRYVPSEELEKLISTPIKNPALDATRDMFVFSCFTGLSYIDLYNLTDEHIVKAEDGSLWLNVSRHKTETISKIPLLDVALQIIKKNIETGSGNRLFPMKCNSHMNKQLKAIATLCGIERRLTFHMARHTFATETCISHGVPIETVSRMMGHTNLATTQIYAKVTHNKVDEEMKSLSEKIKNKYVLAS
jgi:site-specific recombinase XerD